MTKIKATFRSHRGVAECVSCYWNPENVRMLVSYKNQPSIEEAEKLLYEDMFREQMELQNEAYRKKGNYGRVWTPDEFRTSVRYRPIENVLQIGNEKNFLPPRDMWHAYCKYHEWREENFSDNCELISIVIYDGITPHIHERYVLYWTDEQGVRHIGIEKALEQTGVGIPFPEMKKGRNNNRKMMFDRIMREAWLDAVEEKLQAFPGMELERPDPEFKLRIGSNRDFKLESGHRSLLRNAWERYARRSDELSDRLIGLRKEREEIRNKLECGSGTADEMAALRERQLIVKGKIKRYEEQIEKMNKKLDSIDATIVNL